MEAKLRLISMQEHIKKQQHASAPKGRWEYFMVQGAKTNTKPNYCRHILFADCAICRAVATGPVGPISTGPLSGVLSHVFVVNQRLMAARTSFKASLLSLPDTPHHLKDVAFPKRTFRKSKPVLCSAWSHLAIPALCIANVLGETPLRDRSMR